MYHALTLLDRADLLGDYDVVAPAGGKVELLRLVESSRSWSTSRPDLT